MKNFLNGVELPLKYLLNEQPAGWKQFLPYTRKEQLVLSKQ